LATLPADLARVERKVFEATFKPNGLTESQFLKLLEFAEWHVAAEDEMLCEQGLPVRDVVVPISGDFSIRTGAGKFVANIPVLQLVGEVSLLENLQSPGGRFHRQAVASMVAAAGSTYVRFPQQAFYDLMQTDEEFSNAMNLMISKALSRKLQQLWEGPQNPSPAAAAGEPPSSASD